MKRVLVVDDTPDYTELVKLQLEHAGGFEVLTENNSRRAIQTVREFSPNVILLDIMMPGIDGSDIAAQLREQPDLSDIPIIFFSALITRQEIRTFDHGSRMYLPKSTTLPELVQIINQTLESFTNRCARLADADIAALTAPPA